MGALLLHKMPFMIHATDGNEAEYKQVDRSCDDDDVLLCGGRESNDLLVTALGPQLSRHCLVLDEV